MNNTKLIEAVGKLVKAKGRFHTEQNYKAVVEAYDEALAERATEAGTPAKASEPVDRDKLRKMVYRVYDERLEVTDEAMDNLIEFIDQRASARAEDARREGYNSRNAEVDALILEKWGLEEKLATGQRTAGGDAVAICEAVLASYQRSLFMFPADVGIQACIDALKDAARPVAEAAAQADGSGDTLADYDKILRSSVPDRWKDCTSPIGAAQSYIAELEQRLAQYEPDWADNDFDMGERTPHGLPIGAAPTAQPTPNEKGQPEDQPVSATRFRTGVRADSVAQPTLPDDERAAFDEWRKSLPEWHDARTGFEAGDAPYWDGWQARAALRQPGALPDEAEDAALHIARYVRDEIYCTGNPCVTDDDLRRAICKADAARVAAKQAGKEA